MKKSIYLVLAIALLACSSNSTETIAQENPDNTSETTNEIEKLASGFMSTEGPTNDGNGNIYFSDIPNNKILIWKTTNELATYKTNSNGSNGLFFDKDNNLLACEMSAGRVTATSSNGNYTTIASEYNGSRFNEPNDLWADGNGGVYFSDPKYGPGSTYQDGMHVYYINPSRDAVTRVTNDLEKPNGLYGTPDGNSLYITDSEADKTYKYDIKSDGTLTNKTLFVAQGGDGMTVASNGNVYMAVRDEMIIAVYSSNGTLLKSIAVPETPSNVCLGGTNENELYITAKTALYRVKLD